MEAITENRIFKIRRNLSDAGCEEALIQKFLSLDQKQEREEQYRLLSRHRAALLENLHQDQYKIDCLDYMVYTMKKEENVGSLFTERYQAKISGKANPPTAD